MRHVVVLCVSVSCVFMAACSRSSSDGEGAPAPAARVAVEAARVSIADIDVLVTATGTTDVLRKQVIMSPVAGSITALKTLEGTPVTRGTLMAQVRPKEAQSAIAGAQSLLRGAHTDAQRAAAQRAIAIAESTQTTVDILAALDGVVATRAVAEGEIVAENAPMFTIIDLASIVFVADVPLQDLAGVHAGQRATVTFAQLPGREYPSVVQALNPQAEASSQSVKVRIVMEPRSADDRAMLRSGITGTARIVTGVHRHALTVPRTALIRSADNDSYSVMTIGGDSLAHIVPVTIGALSDAVAEVRGALSDGTPVITRGGYALADSTRVTIAPPIQR